MHRGANRDIHCLREIRITQRPAEAGRGGRGRRARAGRRPASRAKHRHQGGQQLVEERGDPARPTD